MDSGEDVNEDDSSLFQDERLRYILMYWIGPPVFLIGISIVVGIFVTLVTAGGYFAGWITDRTGILLFFVVSYGMLIFSPPLTGLLIGYWKGINWEIPVSIYFGMVFISIGFSSFSQFLSTIFILSPMMAIGTGVGMVVSAYIFSYNKKE